MDDRRAESASPFTAPRWLGNPHLQTLGAALPLWARRSPPALEEAVVIPLPPASGGALHGVALWQEGPSPAVVLVHGVGGTSESRYLVRAARAFHGVGYHVLRLNLRGAGEGARAATSLYHAGLTEDLASATDWIASTTRVDGVFVLGFSLGGHVTLRWAGEMGSSVPAFLRAVATISAPFDLERATQWIERYQSLPYHLYVVKNLLDQGRRFARLHPERAHFSGDDLRCVRTVRQYDTLVVAPMHGFRSAEDYYAKASARPLVGAIEAATLVVHAEDDPMVAAGHVRDALIGAPPAIEERWSRRGGHVGWFGALGKQAWLRTWAIDRALDFFARHRGLPAPRPD